MFNTKRIEELEEKLAFLVESIYGKDAEIVFQKKKTFTEIILAFPANPEGDATAVKTREELADAGARVTTLGRGLSTGSELEYADAETLKTALANRR
jgi:recombination protein RecR